MLEAGADPNAYGQRGTIHSFNLLASPLQMAAYRCRVDIVEVLLQAGSDINAPAKGVAGFSALQASCRSRPKSLEDQQRKLRTIFLLLAHVADVNTAPARVRGTTALQEAATSGDLAVAKLLLFHNPMADVNAPPCEYIWEDWHDSYLSPLFGMALDCAAGKGRIDMVQLLLNWNALSHRWGKTGYDGAIQNERRKRYVAIADLICQHAQDARRSDASPDLSQPRRDYHEYGYDSNPDGASECSIPEFSFSFSYTNEQYEDYWESKEVGFVSSGTHSSDPFVLAHVLDAHDSTPPLDQDGFLRTTANENGTWPDQESFVFSQDEELMGIGQFGPRF